MFICLNTVSAFAKMSMRYICTLHRSTPMHFDPYIHSLHQDDFVTLKNMSNKVFYYLLTCIDIIKIKIHLLTVYIFNKIARTFTI